MTDRVMGQAKNCFISQYGYYVPGQGFVSRSLGLGEIR